MGLTPMAQLPGWETLASRYFIEQRPQHGDGGPHALHEVIGGFPGRVTLVGSTSMVVSSVLVNFTPRVSSTCPMVVMSRSLGTLV